MTEWGGLTDSLLNVLSVFNSMKFYLPSARLILDK